MTTSNLNSNPVVLQLLGIDKKWVRSPKGEWVDKKTLKKETIELSVALEETYSKKWWKFWGNINKL